MEADKAWGSFEEHDVSGTKIRLAVRQSPGGMVGVWGTWGERLLTDQLLERIAARTGVSSSDLNTDTGFTEVWYEPEGMTRPQSIKAQKAALGTLISRTLDVNNIRPHEVRGLSVASGVPMIGEGGIEGDSMVDFVAEEFGFTNLMYRSETFAACASGEIEKMKLLGIPELQGQPVLPIAFEPITSIVPFDKNRADRLSMSLFGDGMAASIIYPGVDLKLEETVFNVEQDVNRVLTAHMTYEHLIDWDLVNADEPKIWQQNEDGKTQWIVGGTPPEGMMINMVPGETGVFFKNMALRVMIELDTKHRERRPNQPIKLVYAHHPNRTINNNVAKNLERRGHPFNIPWVVFTYNSSAATSSEAFTELQEQMEPGNVVAGVAYGAGGSAAAYTAEVGSRWTHQSVDPEKHIFPAAA